MNIEKDVKKKQPRTSLMGIAHDDGYRVGKQDGYFEGLDKGREEINSEAYEEGYRRGIGSFDSMVAEQMDVLIKAMAMLLGSKEIDTDHWVLLRTMSEVNAKNMVTPEKAWHVNNKTLKHRKVGA